MKKTYNFLLSIIFVFLGIIIPLSYVKSVYFASDTVLIYYKNQIAEDISVLSVSKNTEKRCIKGVCSIGQQYYPVTVYMAKTDIILPTMEQYRFRNSLEEQGLSHKEEREIYIKYLEGVSEYSVSFDPGSSGRITGDRMGEYRSYRLNITNGNYRKNIGHNLIENILDNRISVVFPFIIIAILGIFLFLRKKKSFKK